jgi:hypothetical protein
MQRKRARQQSAPKLPIVVGLTVLVGLAVLAWLALPQTVQMPTDSGSIGAAPASGTDGASRLAVAQPVVDLGAVPFDKLVEARFELTNTGTSPVRLVGKPEVKTLDGC